MIDFGNVEPNQDNINGDIKTMSDLVLIAVSVPFGKKRKHKKSKRKINLI